MPACMYRSMHVSLYACTYVSIYVLCCLEMFPNISVVSLHAVGLNEFQQVDDAVVIMPGMGLMKVHPEQGMQLRYTPFLSLHV